MGVRDRQGEVGKLSTLQAKKYMAILESKFSVTGVEMDLRTGSKGTCLKKVTKARSAVIKPLYMVHIKIILRIYQHLTHF